MSKICRQISSPILIQLWLHAIVTKSHCLWHNQRMVLRLLVVKRHVWAYLHLLLKRTHIQETFVGQLRQWLVTILASLVKNIGNNFYLMFPDSLIATNIFVCWKENCPFGVAPHVLEFIKGKRIRNKIVTFCSLMKQWTVN